MKRWVAGMTWAVLGTEDLLEERWYVVLGAKTQEMVLIRG